MVSQQLLTVVPRLQSLIPQNNRVPFHDFITARHELESPRSVVFDIDDALFANRWQVTRPLLVSVMKDGRRIEDEDEVLAKSVVAYDRSGGLRGGHGPRKMTVVQEEKDESEDEGRDGETHHNVSKLSMERRRRRSSGAMTPVAYAARLLKNHRRRKQPEEEDEEEKSEEQHVLLFSPLGTTSTLMKRLREDLRRVGIPCSTLDLATDSDREVQRQLADARNVVFLIEARADVNPASDIGDNADNKAKVKDANTKWSRKQVSDALGRVLRLASAVDNELKKETKDAAGTSSVRRVRVLPIVVQRNFLDLSKMYSLSRSELYYFMDDGGVQWNRSAGILLARIQREQDSYRLRIGQ